MSITEPSATVPFNRTARTATGVESIKQSILDHVCSRTLFVLTVVTVLALPLTIIPGLLGMNPEIDKRGGARRNGQVVRRPCRVIQFRPQPGKGRGVAVSFLMWRIGRSIPAGRS